MGNTTNPPAIFVIFLAILFSFKPDLYAADGDPERKIMVSTFRTSPARLGGDLYTTGIGLRGGFTSGLSFKQFLGSTTAVEALIGTRWHGLNIAALFELHKGNAFGISQLTWEYGVGARIGFYRGRYYYRNCNDPLDPECNNSYNTTFMAIGVIGIGGLEYKFDGAPLTVSLDLMPYFDFLGWGGGFIDGSVSIRYVIE